MMRVVSLAGIVVVATVTGGCVADERIDPQHVKQVHWELFLVELPVELECYFTIERLEHTLEELRSMPPEQRRERSPFHRDVFTPAPNITSVEEVVAKLRREMTGVTIVQNENNPAVIHIIERPLLDIDDYVMNAKVNVTYSGILHGLIRELGKQVPSIRSFTGGPLRSVIVPRADHVSRVEVNVKDQMVREVLTGCVPLEFYLRILWTATTRKGPDGRYETRVGHTPDPFKRWK